MRPVPGVQIGVALDQGGFGFYPGCGKRGQGRVSSEGSRSHPFSFSKEKGDLLFLEKQITLPVPGEKKSIGRAKRLFPRLRWHHLRFVSWDGKRAFVKVTGAPHSSSLFPGKWAFVKVTGAPHSSSLFPGKCAALVASCWRVGLGRPDASPWLRAEGKEDNGRAPLEFFT